MNCCEIEIRGLFTNSESIPLERTSSQSSVIDLEPKTRGDWSRISGGKSSHKNQFVESMQLLRPWFAIEKDMDIRSKDKGPECRREM